MNKPQRIVLFVAAAIIGGMCLYSPRTSSYMGGRRSFDGYYFILDHWGNFSESIDFSRLLSQIVIVLILAVLLVLAFKKSN
jgi:hypothetical protein